MYKPSLDGPQTPLVRGKIWDPELALPWYEINVKPVCYNIVGSTFT